MKKTQYEAPVLRVHGKVESVTQGNSTGVATDQSFPSPTPVSDVTFS